MTVQCDDAKDRSLRGMNALAFYLRPTEAGLCKNDLLPPVRVCLREVLFHRHFGILPVVSPSNCADFIELS